MQKDDLVPNQHQPANQTRNGTMNNQCNVAHKGSAQNLGAHFKNWTRTDNQTTQLDARAQAEQDRDACRSTKQWLKKVYFTFPSFFLSPLNLGDDFEQCSWLTCSPCWSSSTGPCHKWNISNQWHLVSVNSYNRFNDYFVHWYSTGIACIPAKTQ